MLCRGSLHCTLTNHADFPCWDEFRFWSELHQKTFVLVLAGIELIFFIVASMGQCFGFVLKTVLITQRCFSYCWAGLTQSQGLFCFSPQPTSEQAEGGTRSWEGTQPGQLTPTDQKDIPDHMTSCLAYKAGGRRRNRGTFGVTTFVFPSHCYAWWSPAFLEMAEHLPAHGKLWMNSLVCFVCMCGICFTY